MAKRTYKVEAQPDGQGGATPVILDKSNIGFSPADTLVNVQISTTGLDGGDYAVRFFPVDGFDFVDVESLVPQTSAVLMSQGFMFDKIKIDFSNLGAAASPEVAITFMSRSF
jgi:hypothetical protein